MAERLGGGEPVMMAESVFVAGMATAAVCDLRSRRVPNRLTFPLLALGIAARGVVGGPAEAGFGVLGALIGLGVLLPLFARGWIGGGDVKLAAAAGAWLAPRGALLVVLFGLALGGVHALLIAARTDRRTRAEVADNLRYALLARRAPVVPRRRQDELVPLALSLAAAAAGVLLYTGGVHG